MIRLYCATGNHGKLREFQMASGQASVQIELLPRFHDLPVCIEDGSTFEENAMLKARHYGKYAPGPLFADDSGLEVDALDGAPGVLSARFSGASATDASNNALLLEKLHGVENRTARFVCVIALVNGDSVYGAYRGSVEGSILHEARGTNGFGYDPLFYYPPFGRSFGETTDEEKFAVSHRGQALRAVLQAIPGVL